MKNIINKILISLITIFSSLTMAHDAEISGLWFEAMNFPSSSVLKFEKVNDSWHGKYTQVSAAQIRWGYSIDETIIKGKFVKEHFVGKVLIKNSKKAKAYCKNTKDRWEDIKMEFIDSDKLYGSWYQHKIDYKGNCDITAVGWQTYGLERLKQ